MEIQCLKINEKALEMNYLRADFIDAIILMAYEKEDQFPKGKNKHPFA